MEDRGIPVEIIKIFQFWYRHQTNYVKWAGSLSEPYKLECGVRQGGLTSPKIFNMYLNDLIIELSSMRVGCRVGGVCVNNISYADDMALLGPTAGSIGQMIRVCEKYAASHGLIYNVKKSEFMLFKAASRGPDILPPINLNGTRLNRVTRFKYLGHILADDLKDDDDVERERRALAARGNMLARRFSRCTDQVKITLFKAYCQGLYTGSLWFACSQRSLDALRIQYNNFFRMLMKLPRFCSASVMFAQAQTDGFHAIIRKKVASLVRRLRESDNSILKAIASDPKAPVLRHLVRTMIPQGMSPKYMTH
ncbi:uncharacterized protein LOC106712835 [Papilio machaon]|nr:uncharacterized protein LOC106712835 [Papilio machaon]